MFGKSQISHPTLAIMITDIIRNPASSVFTLAWEQ